MSRSRYVFVCVLIDTTRVSLYPPQMSDDEVEKGIELYHKSVASAAAAPSGKVKPRDTKPTVSFERSWSSKYAEEDDDGDEEGKTLPPVSFRKSKRPAPPQREEGVEDHDEPAFTVEGSLSGGIGSGGSANGRAKYVSEAEGDVIKRVVKQARRAVLPQAPEPKKKKHKAERAVSAAAAEPVTESKAPTPTSTTKLITAAQAIASSDTVKKVFAVVMERVKADVVYMAALSHDGMTIPFVKCDQPALAGTKDAKGNWQVQKHMIQSLIQMIATEFESINKDQKTKYQIVKHADRVEVTWRKK